MQTTDRFDMVSRSFRGLQLLIRKPIGDNRGYLERLFCLHDLQPVLAGKMIVQINRTLTVKKGTVRGMHFQYPPHSELKIVSCLKGMVFDVVIDIRRDSTTFGRWHGETLSADNHKSLVIPEGFAHGFQTLTSNCEMLYFHTAAYNAESEGGLNATDPKFAIQWPLPILELSSRDRSHPLLRNDFDGIVL